MTFSGIAASITGGSMGVFDFLVAGGRGGVAYSVFSGRTMIFIGPIGLTLAFTTALYAFCRQWHPRFMPLHSRTGVRTALWLMLLAVADAPELMSCCTQLTDYACTFVHEAAVFCWGMSLSLSYRWRFVKKDTGPAIISRSLVAALPLFRGRGLLRLPLSFQMIGFVPAIVLTALSFVDHDIPRKSLDHVSAMATYVANSHWDFRLLPAQLVCLTHLFAPKKSVTGARLRMRLDRHQTRARH
ncbi:unnamed protein product [Vitrella brassicaformis CCMP3155]|uniref:Bicarbonate transporter-like transmembrane domain-containing protein n=1 Tax=Vitrella brassicaformis (strain CCMP3155) TaxID=1169540 RepID=A0A0G4EIH7_VITBC|nr:unnamed protein product [Vitrella brassicaformis CCMP3155]|eukprot:CEL95687.1 unnamed protein product [Vitrella brassicaformis CCMP3155]